MLKQVLLVTPHIEVAKSIERGLNRLGGIEVTTVDGIKTLHEELSKAKLYDLVITSLDFVHGDRKGIKVAEAVGNKTERMIVLCSVGVPEEATPYWPKNITLYISQLEPSFGRRLMETASAYLAV